MKIVYQIITFYFFISFVNAINVTYISSNSYDCLIFVDLDNNVFSSCNKTMISLPADRDYLLYLGNNYFIANSTKTNPFFSVNNSIAYSDKTISLTSKLLNNISILLLILLFVILFIGIFIYLFKRIIRYLL